MRDNYEDILSMPYPGKRKHPIISNEERAAQFAPFAALRGYDDVIYETYRYTSAQIELDDGALTSLDEKMAKLLGGKDKQGKFTYFVKDNTKEGGQYVTVIDSIKKVDMYDKTILLMNGTQIKFIDLVDLEEL